MRKKEFLKIADKIGEKNNIPVSFNIRVSHKIYQGILDSVLESKGNLLILGSGGAKLRGKILGHVLDPLLQEVPCDTGILKIKGNDKIKKILIPAAGGPNARLAFEWGSWIIKHNKGVHYEKKGVEDKIVLGKISSRQS